MKKHYLLKTEADTKKLAQTVASELRGGKKVIGLIGDLGAGKTTFTKYLAAALGVTKTVVSPTFTIMQVYEADAPAIKRFVHIDAYRLSSADDLAALGVEEYFGDPETVTVVEWADKIQDLLPPQAMIIQLQESGGQHIATIK